jgi:AraC-like DNA-binding protein
VNTVLPALSVSPPVVSRIQTTDPEAAHAVLSAMYVEHVPTLSGDRERFRFETIGTRTNLLGVDRGRHSMTVQTEVNPGRALYITRVLRGRLQLGTDSDTLRAVAGDVVLAGPGVAHDVHWSDLRWEVVRLDEVATAGLAAGVLDVEEPTVRFGLSRPVSPAQLRYWRAVLDQVTAVLDVAEIAASPLARSEAFRVLASATLHTFPHSALEAVTAGRTGPGTVEPAVLRRAVEFIEAHAGEPIGLAQIAAAARVGGRGLQLAFRRYRGTTPLEFVRAVRMERARADLLAADAGSGDTVASIATRWGFIHHGHFAIDYRRRFGCSPSTTLRGH